MIILAFALFAVLIVAWLAAPAAEKTAVAPVATPVLTMGEAAA